MRLPTIGNASRPFFPAAYAAMPLKNMRVKYIQKTCRVRPTRPGKDKALGGRNLINKQFGIFHVNILICTIMPNQNFICVTAIFYMSWQENVVDATHFDLFIKTYIF